MEKRQPFGSLDYLGADTYGWPLPARQITITKATHPARAAEPPAVSAAPQAPDVTPAPSVQETPPLLAASGEPVQAPPAPRVDLEIAPEAMTPDGVSLPLMEAPLPEAPPSAGEAPPAAEAPPLPTINPPLEVTCEAPSEPAPHLATPPRPQVPSIFMGEAEPESIRPTDFWSKTAESAIYSDWKQVIEASTPSPKQEEALVSDLSVDYPPILVNHPNDMAARQVLRLYAGEKSAMTLFHCYLYNSICFEEDCPQLASLMGRLTTDALFLTQTLGKLALAFGADPRPRVMQSQRGQFWNGNYVTCVRVPRKAILSLIELERHLAGEIVRFMNATRDTGAKALLARIVADGEQRLSTLNHALTLGCV